MHLCTNTHLSHFSATIPKTIVLFGDPLSATISATAYFRRPPVFGDLFGDRMFSATTRFRRPHVFGDRTFSATFSATAPFRRPPVFGWLTALNHILPAQPVNQQIARQPASEPAFSDLSASRPAANQPISSQPTSGQPASSQPASSDTPASQVADCQAASGRAASLDNTSQTARRRTVSIKESSTLSLSGVATAVSQTCTRPVDAKDGRVVNGHLVIFGQAKTSKQMTAAGLSRTLSIPLQRQRIQMRSDVPRAIPLILHPGWRLWNLLENYKL